MIFKENLSEKSKSLIFGGTKQFRFGEIKRN